MTGIYDTVYQEDEVINKEVIELNLTEEQMGKLIYFIELNPQQEIQ